MEEEDIGRFFDAARAFIDGAAAAGGAVLVHCHEGKSRSVTLVLAYFMQTQACSPHMPPHAFTCSQKCSPQQQAVTAHVLCAPGLDAEASAGLCKPAPAAGQPQCGLHGAPDQAGGEPAWHQDRQGALSQPPVNAVRTACVCQGYERARCAPCS
jgi:hypothetical protein